ncbi:MAG: ADP-ribose pyrophosphatase, partial [uncultured bacterium]
MISCKFENDRVANLRHVVVDAVIVKDNKVLLTKRALTLREGGKWAVPGGYVERDETALEAVMREVLEETGYSCVVDQLITVLDSPIRRGDDRQNISFVFAAHVIK